MDVMVSLGRVATLANLPPWQLDMIAEAVEPLTVSKGTLIVERGSDDGYTYFLTAGEVLLDAGEETNRVLAVSEETVRTPIANLRPRIFNVRATKAVRGFRIPDIVLTAAGCDGRRHDEAAIQVTSAEEGERRELESRLSFRLYRDLKADRAILPSLPDLAMRVRKAIDDDVGDARSIARLVESDPAMAAKLLKAANSALYGGLAKMESTAAAVTRLGMDTTRQLVLSFALKDVFVSDDKLAQRKMKELWKHSAKIAALCFVLARHVRGLRAEEALLIGLLHDIGTIAILNYLHKYPDLADDEEALDITIARLRGELGAMILRSWRFPAEIIAGARDAEHWLRKRDGEPDFTDLIIVAQVHDLLRTDRASDLPPFEDISAVKRVFGREATAEKSIQVLHEAKHQIDAMRSVLRG